MHHRPAIKGHPRALSGLGSLPLPPSDLLEQPAPPPTPSFSSYHRTAAASARSNSSNTELTSLPFLRTKAPHGPANLPTSSNRRGDARTPRATDGRRPPPATVKAAVTSAPSGGRDLHQRMRRSALSSPIGRAPRETAGGAGYRRTSASVRSASPALPRAGGRGRPPRQLAGGPPVSGRGDRAGPPVGLSGNGF